MKTITLAACVLVLGASGCLSMQSQTSLDNAATSTQPYVEGYVEYPGPPAKWAGPTSFILHVVAKDAGPAQISVAPALFTPPGRDGTTMGRLPASIKGLSGEAAREQLGHLATSLQGASTNFRGCLSPVRVRLVRADGALLEKQGCRSQSGWGRAASDTVNQFITAALYGTGQGPRMPAAAAVPVSSVRH